MLSREPFLLAIFADPGSDLPRLAFADHLDDTGDPDWAELIRLQCDLHPRGMGEWTLSHVRRLRELRDRRFPGAPLPERGFQTGPGIDLPAEALADPDGFRRLACEGHPHWYGADRLRVVSGRLTEPTAVETLLRSPVTQRVTALDLGGREEPVGTARDEGLGVSLTDFVYRPVVTTRVVEHLCTLRECRRLVSLDLTRNELGNDAVRALVRSTNLIRLRELVIHDGNPRVKGRLWGELTERFGPEVVR